MKIKVTLNLSRYDNEMIFRLYKSGVISEAEAIQELMERGLKDWKAMIAVKSIR